MDGMLPSGHGLAAVCSIRSTIELHTESDFPIHSKATAAGCSKSVTALASSLASFLFPPSLLTSHLGVNKLGENCSVLFQSLLLLRACVCSR